MLIDFHTHCFPDAIAPKAIEKLAFVSGGFIPYTDGTAASLGRLMEQEGVDLSVVLSIATNAHQQQNVNDFAAAINNNKSIVAFGSVFPRSEDVFEQLEKIKERGLKGVKLHPDYQGFQVDDQMMKPIYRKISELGLITVFHAGVDCGFAPPYGCMPKNLERALEWFDTPVVAAHWGGAGCYEEVVERLCGKQVYFDTAFGYSQLPRYFAQKIVEKHGTDKILFGTDAPWHTPSMEMRLLNTLGLNENEMADITHRNAQKLLAI